jgi:hypothetical protein
LTSNRLLHKLRAVLPQRRLILPLLLLVALVFPLRTCVAHFVVLGDGCHETPDAVALAEHEASSASAAEDAGPCEPGNSSCFCNLDPSALAKSASHALAVHPPALLDGVICMAPTIAVSESRSTANAGVDPSPPVSLPMLN